MSARRVWPPDCDNIRPIGHGFATGGWLNDPALTRDHTMSFHSERASNIFQAALALISWGIMLSASAHLLGHLA